MLCGGGSGRLGRRHCRMFSRPAPPCRRCNDNYGKLDGGADRSAPESARLARSPRYPNRVSAHWARDVVQALLAEVTKGEVELARGVFLHPRRHTDPARFGDRFKPRRNIDAIAKD